MRTTSLLRVAVLILSLPLCPPTQGEDKASTVRLGIMPTFDEGGDPFGAVFSQHFTMMLFRDLDQRRLVTPVLLNPGAVYTPSSDEWISDYGQQAGVDEVLVTALEKTEMPKTGSWTIGVRSELVEIATGKRSAAWTESAAIEKRNAVLDYGIDLYAHDVAFVDPSKSFEKQPLGKRARNIADAIAEGVPPRITLPPTHVAEAPEGSGSCAINFKISYSSKHAASHAYTAIINGKDESLGIRDGVLPLTVNSGPLVIQAMVQDAPYKLPKQPVYQANTNVRCSAAHDLILDIGAAGEALLKWQ